MPNPIAEGTRGITVGGDWGEGAHTPRATQATCEPDARLVGALCDRVRTASALRHRPSLVRPGKDPTTQPPPAWGRGCGNATSMQRPRVSPRGLAPTPGEEAPAAAREVPEGGCGARS